MNRNLKSFYLILSSLFISLLHLPFAFGKSSAREKNAVLASVHDFALTEGSYKSVYDSLKLDLTGLSRQAFDYAKNGWEKLKSQGKLLNQSVIAIVDFSQPSSQKRLYVLDMNNYKVLYNTLVAHGRNSGRETASYFSNKPSSYNIPNEKVTIFDAIGLAGDLTVFGRRDNIRIIRENGDKKETGIININDGNVFNSPYYFLKQNDIVYVEMNERKLSSADQLTTRRVSLALAAVTAVSLIITTITRF